MTVTARRERVSPATRNAFRSLATDLTVRIVAELWEDHGFAPIPPESNAQDLWISSGRNAEGVPSR